jgi:prepilin signal peptidase PulO-like enzyme (type II secretory pathway)
MNIFCLKKAILYGSQLHPPKNYGQEEQFVSIVHMSIEVFIYCIIFSLGASIGSFLNVIADRLIREETFIRGKSYCEKCHHLLNILDLIPIISFFFLQGRCRYCKVKLSFYYPFSEIFTGIIFLLVFHMIGLTSPLLLVFYLYSVSALLIIFLSDIKYGIIPDKIIYPGVLITFFFQLLTQYHFPTSYVFSAIGSGAFFLLLFLITKGKGMGFGDVKLGFYMGLLLGFPFIIYALYMAFLTGAFVSFILILWRRKNFKSTIPFGPFLVIATMIVMIFPQLGDFVMKIIVP